MSSRLLVTLPWTEQTGWGYPAVPRPFGDIAIDPDDVASISPALDSAQEPVEGHCVVIMHNGVPFTVALTVAGARERIGR